MEVKPDAPPWSDIKFYFPLCLRVKFHTPPSLIVSECNFQNFFSTGSDFYLKIRVIVYFIGIYHNVQKIFHFKCSSNYSTQNKSQAIQIKIIKICG